MVVIDTGVLLRGLRRPDPNYQLVRQVFVRLMRSGTKLVTFSQNIAEFWVVSTRPENVNGYGLTTGEVVAQINTVERFVEVLGESPGSYAVWKSLVKDYDVRGKSSHDARIVAQMKDHSLDTLLTFNVQDFKRYDGLTVLTPGQALSS